MNQDFNSNFWRVWGVNNRVYEPLDIFTVKATELEKEEIKKYKNLKRDKQADSESYDNFLKNDDLLGNEKFFEHLMREPKIFYIFFVDYLLGDLEQLKFYINQLNNITINYRIFKKQNLYDEKFINLFAFQIALIIETMNHNNINISNFEKSLNENSIMTFFDEYREIRDCNNKKKKLTQKDLAKQLSDVHYKMKENYEKKEIYLETITAGKFAANLSDWKNNKEYPSFVKMLVIINIISKGNIEEKTGIFFQLLIIRGLLYLQKEFDISTDIKNRFIDKFEEFRRIIKSHFLSNDESEIFKLQNQYLVNFPNRLEEPERELKSFLNEIESKLKEFAKHNEGDKPIEIALPNKGYITETFNSCKTKEDFEKLLNEIIDVDKEEPNSDFINQSNDFVRFVISIKIEDVNLFTKRYKYLDRGFGSLLSNGGVDKNLSECIQVLKDKTDFIVCINLIAEHFKKLSTLG